MQWTTETRKRGHCRRSRHARAREGGLNLRLRGEESQTGPLCYSGAASELYLWNVAAHGAGAGPLPAKASQDHFHRPLHFICAGCVCPGGVHPPVLGIFERLTLAGLEPEFFGSEDQRLIH